MNGKENTIYVKTFSRATISCMEDYMKPTLTHFQPMLQFYTLLKTLENLRFSDVFRGYRSGTLVKNGLNPPPPNFILHVGTNDLSSEKSSMEIAESIINLASRLKNGMHDVSVSTIILWTDDKKLNEKGMEINFHLKELSKEKNIF